MKDAITRLLHGFRSRFRCSFCGKPTGTVSNLVLTRGRFRASVCDECLEICGKILKKYVEKPGSGEAYRIGAEPAGSRKLSCSFCGTSQDDVHRLIASSPRLALAYICDGCVERCFVAITENATVKNQATISNWIARKTGIHHTTIHRIG